MRRSDVVALRTVETRAADQGSSDAGERHLDRRDRAAARAERRDAGRALRRVPGPRDRSLVSVARPRSSVVLIFPHFRRTVIALHMIVLIDNYDSFTYNLVQKLGEVDRSRPIKVFRNDKVTVEQVQELKPTHVVISPGP